MCGLTAILGNINLNIIIESLKQLQNRGYDSAGISIMKDNNFLIFKELFKESIINLEIKKFSNASDIVWAQEEPKNMGAWSHIQMHLPISNKLRPATRRFYGSTASGSYARFERRHNQVIEYVFDKQKNNFRN